ncbi:MAG: M16 family metallopeptidase [Thermoguttaceae bacterium]
MARIGGFHHPRSRRVRSRTVRSVRLERLHLRDGPPRPRDSRQFINDLDCLGVERGESVGEAHTRYGGATLADNLPEALAIFADLLRRPRLPADQLEAGRQVMIQELRAVEDEPAQKLMLMLRQHHYPDPWGRPSQGDSQGIEATSIGDIRSHFRQAYNPQGTILGVAGRVDWESLKDTVGRLLADWKSVARPSVTESSRDAAYKHVDYDSGQTHIGIAYPSVPYRDEDYYLAWASVGILSGGTSARLFTEVRERRGLCYSVYASHHTLLNRGSVFCYAGTTAERAQETLDVTLGELRRLADGVDEQELDRLKARIKSALIMQQESSSSRSASIARDWYYLGRSRSLDEINGLVDRLSADRINAYLRKSPPAHFTVVTLGRKELEVPLGVS